MSESGVSVEELIAAIPDGTEGTALTAALGPVFDAMLWQDPFSRVQTAKLLKRLGVAKSDVLAQVRELEERRKNDRSDERNYALLTTGSDAEVGRVILSQMANGGRSLIHSEQEFWQYSPKAGIWAKVETTMLEKLAHELDGEVCSEGIWKANDPRVRGAVRCARAHVDAPGFFDEAPAGIAFANGFLRIDAQGIAQFETYTPEHRVRAALDVVYSPGAPATRWLRYLAEIFRDDADATSKILLLQQFVGACLVGIATRYARCMVFIGEGNNGKSVFLDVVRELFPASARAATSPQKFSSEYYVARLAGARINIVAETPRTDMEHSEGFKAIISGDVVDARHPTERPFQYKPVAGHLFACNTLPGTGDQTWGFWKRFLLVTFNRTFTDDEADKTLASTIVNTELGGVVNWALEGARSLITSGGYVQPDSMVAAKREWREDSDQVLRFAQEKLELVEDKTKGTMGSVIYKSYVQWAEENGLRRTTMSNTMFARRLKQLPDMNYASEHTDHGTRWNARLKLHLVAGMRVPFSK